MRMFLAAGATFIGVAVLLFVPRWLRYTAALNARKQREALERRWFKTPAE